MKLLNKKGMTLFELLAVIIILGIVAAIAFPTVGRLISNQRKSAFAEEANMFVSYTVQLAELEKEDFNEGDTFTYYLNPDEGEDVDEQYDVSDNFSRLSSDYNGKITFKFENDKLTITEFEYSNDKYKIVINAEDLSLNMKFNRDNVEDNNDNSGN